MGNYVTRSELSRSRTWKQETIYPLIINEIEGGHFFIFEQMSQIKQIIL